MPHTLQSHKSPLEQFEAAAPGYVVSPADLYRYPWPNHGEEKEAYGVYFLWGPDHGLLYIGSSSCILTRLAQHHWAEQIPFVAFSFIEMEDYGGLCFIEHMESAYIRALTPPLNYLTRGHRFKHVKRIEKAISAAWAEHEFVPASSATISTP